MRQPGETVGVVGPRGRAAWPGAVQQSIRDRAAAPDARRRAARTSRPGARGSNRRSRTGRRCRSTRRRTASIHGEADLMPSLIVDRYGDYLVLQTLSQGTDRLLPEITRLLVETVKPAGILARNDPRVRALEGLEQRVEVVHGSVPEVDSRPRWARVYDVDPYKGQKTGLFLDQRENRAAAARYAHGRLLDAFSYHGAFALTLAASCDEVLAVDISEEAVARIRENARAQRPDERRGAGDERLRRAARARTSWRALRHDRARSAGVCEEQERAAESALRLQGDQPPRVEDPPSRRIPDHLHVLVPRERSGRLPRSSRRQRSTRTPTSSWSKSGCSRATIRC